MAVTGRIRRAHPNCISFDPLKPAKSVEAKAPREELDGVLVDQVETELVVQYGPQLVALKAWEERGLSTTLARNPG